VAGNVITLFYSPGACSLSPHIVLRETGVPFELDLVDRLSKKTAEGLDFGALNPKGYVPAIRLDDGSMLTEGAVIVQYIADQKPESGVMPKVGTFERYRAMEWLNFIATEVHKSFSPLFRGDTPEATKENAKTVLARRYAFVDQHLAEKPYLMGETFTAPDAYLFTVTRWTDRVKVDISSFANLVAFQKRVAERPAVKAALEAEAAKK
jgi:glutathione S-transferase